MAELMWNNGPSGSGIAECSAAVSGNSAEDSAAVSGSPRGPTAARETSAAAAAGGGVRGDTTAPREVTLRENASRCFGMTGHRGADVPVEVDPAGGRLDQQRGLENVVHTPAVSWGLEMIYLYLDLLSNTPPIRR